MNKARCRHCGKLVSVTGSLGHLTRWKHKCQHGADCAGGNQWAARCLNCRASAQQFVADATEDELAYQRRLFRAAAKK